MLHFLKTWHYHYKQDKNARSCAEVNGQNFIYEINKATEKEKPFIRNLLVSGGEAIERSLHYERNGFYK